MNNVLRCSWVHVCVIILAALLVATGATTFAAPPVCDVGAGEDVGCARGFETRERDRYGSFRWTDGDASVVLSAVGYGAPRIVEMVLAAPRPPGMPPPLTTLSVDATSITTAPSAVPRRYRLLYAPRFLSGETIRVAIQSETWKPDGDRRNLGVLVYMARVKLSGTSALPPLQQTLALIAIGLATAFVGGRPPARVAIALAAIGMCGFLWVWLPTRTAPFLPLYATLLGSVMILLAWMEQRDLHRQPARSVKLVLLAAISGVVLDALFVTGVARGSWVVPVIGAQAALAVWGVWNVDGHSWSLVDMLRIALTVRLLALAVRLLAGAIGSDPDVELFYSYGRATLELGTPIVEYPSGALIPWALLALPASRELFGVALPLYNTAADLVVIWSIWWTGIRRRNVWGENAEFASLACFYALSPLLLPFWHGKYDSLPTAFLALGLVAFAYRRMGWSGAALGLGGALKWTPWLAASALALLLMRSRRTLTSRSLWMFVAGGMIAIATTSLPFAWINWERFLAPYMLQGGRAITGESLWFLIVLMIAPETWSRLPAPWGAVETGRALVGMAIVVQGVVVAGVTLSALRLHVWSAIAPAALAPAVFLLLNRVFSPQYMVTITTAALIAGAAVACSTRHTRGIIALLTIAQAANLLVWPNTVPWWPLASAVMFITALGALGWLMAVATRHSTSHFHCHREGADL